LGAASEPIAVNNMNMIISYVPEKHEGRENKEHAAYVYHVRLKDGFNNMNSGEYFAGLQAEIVDAFGNVIKHKRFRWDRIISIVPGSKVAA
tara:strand:+ start:594 stop:866 length:273 start_codon:yes stop_codon:yes gene_type:complete